MEIPLGIVEQLLHAAVVPRDAGDRETGTLPELVVVDLGDGGSEAVLQLRLHRFDELALALQRARLGKVQLGGEDPDVAGAHAGIEARARPRPWGPAALRSVRST